MSGQHPETLETKVAPGYRASFANGSVNDCFLGWRGKAWNARLVGTGSSLGWSEIMGALGDPSSVGRPGRRTRRGR